MRGGGEPRGGAPGPVTAVKVEDLQWADYNATYWGGWSQIHVGVCASTGKHGQEGDACVGGPGNKCPATAGADQSLFIAPPGRFPKGHGPFGHADLAGDVYDIAMPPTSQAGVDPSMMSAGLARTGAFDNHAIPQQHPVGGFRTYTASNKYLAVGARCAR